MRERFSDSELRYVRNEIPVRRVLTELCGIECKEVEGYTRFVCPACYEMRTSIHPSENLGRCFRCARNFNAIDFVMSGCKLSFVKSVQLLMKFSSSKPQATSVTTAVASISRLNIS